MTACLCHPDSFRRGVRQPKWHSVALTETQRPFGECSFLLVCFLYLNLPISTLDVQAVEPLGTIQRVEHLIYARQQVGVLLGTRIQLPEVNTEANLAIRLPIKDDRARIGTLGHSDGIKGQHLLQVIPHLFKHTDGMSA